MSKVATMTMLSTKTCEMDGNSTLKIGKWIKICDPLIKTQTCDMAPDMGPDMATLAQMVPAATAVLAVPTLIADSKTS